MMGDPRRSETTDCDSTVVSRRSKYQFIGATKGNGQDSAGTVLLWRVCGNPAHAEEMVSARKRERVQIETWTKSLLAIG